MYSALLILGEVKRYAPAVLIPGKSPQHTLEDIGWDTKPVYTLWRRKNSCSPPENPPRFPGRSARNVFIVLVKPSQIRN
jgi:hypothetical protein